MKRAGRLWLLVGLVLVVGAAERGRSEVRWRLLTQVAHSTGRKWSQEERKALQKVDAVWVVRRKRDSEAVARDIAAYLSDPSPRVWRWAAVRLGRLEWPGAEPEIARCLAALQPRQDDGVSLRLRLALARIRARNLHGWAKLRAVAEGAGIPGGDVPRLSSEVYDPGRKRSWVAGSPADVVMAELLDVLYQMGKRGENIRPIVASLVLRPPQRVLMEGAMVSDDEEITLIFNYLAPLVTYTADEVMLGEDHLPDLGELAEARTTEMLGRIAADPQRYPSNFAVTLIRAVGRMARGPSVSALKGLETHPDAWVADSARQTRERLESSGAML